MLGLKLRDEFLGAHMPGTAISLRTSDAQGAAQKAPEQMLTITYPTADVQTALKAISVKRSGRPIVLIGDRGRGKSHIMAVMHHAIQSPEIVESWLHGWGEKLESNEMKSLKIVKGFVPISEPVHNHEYTLLWELLFDRHPKGEYYRGKFEQMAQSYPPRTLLEKMFKDQPTCLILDEFQTWYTGLPEKDPKTGYHLRQWAYNFMQNLSEIAKDRPEILIFVISVLNNQNDAFQQIHRQQPLLVDFRGPTAKQDRQRLLLHRLFINRDNIPDNDICNLAGIYADERFRILHADKSEAEKSRIRQEVFDCWPFSPELLELLENHILFSEAAQETRDLIRILAQVYRSRGENVPLITPGDFFVDDDSDEVQSLVDSIAVQAGQEKLRLVAQQNLASVRDAGITSDNARELFSAIWIRSMSPGRNVGGTPAELHLDITRQNPVDDNAFQAEITLLIENSVNIHGDEIPGGPLWFSLHENPRSKVRACAKNDKLWQAGGMASAGQITYPGKDIEHLRYTLRHLLVSEIHQPASRVIILGPNWNHDPWSEVDEAYKPQKWDRPILLVIPEQIEGGSSGIYACLGSWLAKHIQTRRNTVRFLLLVHNVQSLYTDRDLIYSARCSFLCSASGWGTDATYRSLYQDFNRPLRQALKTRFNRFAILQEWDYQQPQNCKFDIEKISAQETKIPANVEEKILTNLFDQTEFKKFVLQRAKDADFMSSLIDDLVDPPPPDTGKTIPFLGETKTYEFILDIAAKGHIVLNVSGTWIGRRTQDTSDDEALRYIRSKAFRTGQEMRQIQLGLPGAVGGGTITAPSAPANPLLTTPSAGNPETPSYPPTGIPTGDVTINEGGSQAGDTTTGPSPVPPVPPSMPQTKRAEEPASGINLSGCFESWGISSDKTIDAAKIEFSGLSAQQIKQILQRIPSSFKATMEITYTEEDEQ